jgi:cytochrome P450
MTATIARPPGPGGATTLRRLLVGRTPPNELFASVARDHPRIAHTRLGGEHLYFVNHPDTVRELFVANGRATVKGRALQRSRQLLGNGLLTSEGDQWRRQRRLVQPAFHHDAVARYGAQMVECARAHATARWRDGERVHVDREMAALTLTIVGRTLFGSDLRGDAGDVEAAMRDMVAQFQRRVLPGSEILDLLPLPANRRGLAAMSRLDRLVRRLVLEHRAAGAAAPADVLSALLDAGMDDRQVRDEVMTLVLAGHETTANAMTWSWVLLSANPDERALMEAEVAAEVGIRDPVADSFVRLHRTRAVLAESLRLYPPAWSLGRRLSTDVVVDGWTLPAGSLVVGSQWVLHRDPRFWREPDEFRPDRWLDGSGRFDEAAPGQPRGSWFPFGLGQRVCVGEPFAWLEGVLLLAALAQRWSVDVDPGYDRVVQPAVTLRPRNHVPAVLHAR